MPSHPLDTVVHHLRRILAVPDAREQLTDGQLLDRFLAGREEAAFEVLLRRHGPMVFGVCCRILGQCQDAEDAFQATFLVLVQRGRSIVPREMVGNWLCGVAYRTALDARGKRARRFAREKQVMEMPSPRTEPDPNWPELQALLDQELQRLPEKYRAPMILCDLEGRTRKEVARQLRVPEGTLSSRLATARKMLTQRLTRHGIAVPGGLLAGLLVNHASASPPLPLVAATTQAALLFAAGSTTATGVVSAEVTALMKGVVKAMFLAKLKLVTAALLVVGLVAAGTAFSYSRTGATDPATPPAAAPNEAASTTPEEEVLPPAPVKAEEERPTSEDQDEEEKIGSPHLEKLEQRLRQLEAEARKVRQEMLKESEQDLKKAEAAIDKARQDLQKAMKAGDKAAIEKAQEALKKADQFKQQLLRDRMALRSDNYLPSDAPKVSAPRTPEQELGIGSESLSPPLAAQLGLPRNQGRVLTRVDSNSIAAKAGLQPHDVLVQLDKKAAPSSGPEFQKVLASIKPDTPFEVVILRQGKHQTIEGLKLPPSKPKTGN